MPNEPIMPDGNRTREEELRGAMYSTHSGAEYSRAIEALLQAKEELAALRAGM